MQQEAIHSVLSADKRDRQTGVFDCLNRVISVLLVIFVFSNSFPHTTAIREITLYLSLLFVFILAVAKKIDFTIKSPLTLPFLLFLAWSSFGIFFALNRLNTLNDIYAHYIKYLIVYFLLVNFFRTERQFTILVWTVAVSATLFSFGGMIYFYGIEGHPLADRFGFKELSINYLGFVTVWALILIMGLIFSGGLLLERVFLLLAFLGTSMATMLTQTKGALIAFVISVLMSLWGKWKLILLAGLGMICYLTYSPDYLTQHYFSFKLREMQNDHRVSINRLFLEMANDHPITGIGFGMQTYTDRELLIKYNERVPDRYRQPLEILTPSPHNLYLDIAVRVGWVGFGLFLYVIAVFFKIAWQTGIRGKTEFARTWGWLLAACMVSYLIQSFFADAAFGPQAIAFYSILAMMTILWSLDANGQDPSMAHGTSIRLLQCAGRHCPKKENRRRSSRKTGESTSES